MEVQKKTEKNLQWHPAFYAGIQIELEDDAENLIFENEHQLGTKPFGIDVLIIKKECDKPIKKNIGQIFRGHNIVEYKCPEDYLSIDDFYKVYGYTCFYKADVKIADSILIENITISLVCSTYPKKLIRHLLETRKYQIKKTGDGIYYVIGDKIPIQIIVTKELSKEENLWIRSLTNHLEEAEDAKKLIQEYNKHKEDSLYQSMMNIIVQANQEKFKEGQAMCEALEELMKDKIEEKTREAEKLGLERGEKLGLERGEKLGLERGEKLGKEIGKKIGKEIGKEIGEQIGKSKINNLNKKLAKAGRTDDIIKAAEDKEYQDKLIEEFGL